MGPREVAALIDHSLLKPTLTVDDLEQGCQLARRLNVASVCILPFYVRRTRELLEGSTVRTSTVLGFPHGTQSLRAKLTEAEAYLDDGAEEIDAVVNVSLVLSGRFDAVREEVSSLTSLIHARGSKLKLIFETCYLNRDQKVALCEIASSAKVDWVKTSTGYGTAGATAEDLRLMREHCPETVELKASGGIATLAAVLEFARLGATRIGTSRTEHILSEASESRTVDPPR